MIEHIHQPPGTEVQSISGHYTITQEGRMDYRGMTLLYVVGVAVVDRSCCGAGGCRFVQVPGYITSWRHQTGPEGLAVSVVEPVTGRNDRKAIKALLDLQFPHSQVFFGEA